MPKSWLHPMRLSEFAIPQLYHELSQHAAYHAHLILAFVATKCTFCIGALQIFHPARPKIITINNKLNFAKSTNGNM
jgi:uncharacterized membrane protein YqgA involved in biofilm formation